MELRLHLRYLLQLALVTAGYFLLATVSLTVRYQSSNASPIWPPSGFAFAMLLLLGLRMYPAILLGAFCANLYVFTAHHSTDPSAALWLSLLIGIGNAAEGITGYYLVRKLLPVDKPGGLFEKTSTIFRYALVAAVMSGVSATIGVSGVTLGNIIKQADYAYVWLTWWLGDLSGILLFTPFIVLWTIPVNGTPLFKPAPPKRKGELILLILSTILCSGIIFDRWLFDSPLFHWAYWIIPLLVWSAVRFGQRVTITTIMLCSIIATWGTLHGHGPFSAVAINDSLLIVQGFISIIVVTKLALNISFIERRQTEVKLRQLAGELESRVQERTERLTEVTEMLRQKNIELQKNNEELTAFNYIASHDLQEPLRKIQMFARMVGDDKSTALSERTEDLLKRMETAAFRMQQLINDLLNYSRTDANRLNREKTDLNQLLITVQNDLREKIMETNATIEIGALPEMEIVPFQFEQLFTNLIGNAIKFRKPDISPHIRITGAIEEKEDVPGSTPKGKWYKISVSDNGLGFDPEYNHRIFGLFQRLHGTTEFPGSGLGLSICKKIVENHNGIISAMGNEGVGATIEILLPYFPVIKAS